MTDLFQLAKEITRPLPPGDMGTGHEAVLLILAELHMKVKTIINTTPITKIDEEVDAVFADFRTCVRKASR